MKNNTLSPIFLQSTVGPFSGVGVTGSATPLDIRNPNNTAMLVDQMRFSLRNLSLIPQDVLVGLAVEVLLGSIPLTNRAVTLGTIAPRYFGAQQQPDNDEGPDGDGGVTWHFPRPLYVPPNVQLVVNVAQQRVITVGAYSLNVSIVGRSLPSDFPIPGSIQIPWVTETKCFADVASFVAADSDLVNSNNVPLNVTQFVGINSYQTSNSPTLQNITVQMSLSNGTLLIRDAIPFFLAFPTDRGILPCNARLQAGEFARLELEVPTNIPEVTPTLNFTAVAMHGYREIQTPGTFG